MPPSGVLRHGVSASERRQRAERVQTTGDSPGCARVAVRSIGAGIGDVALEVAQMIRLRRAPPRARAPDSRIESFLNSAQLARATASRLRRRRTASARDDRRRDRRCEISTSWPTAEIVGTAHAANARATRSSLNAHRSSRAPPPRPMITRSALPSGHTRSSAAHSSARCSVALHGRRDHDEPDIRGAAAQHGDDVVQRRAVGARDDGDDAREAGQRALAVGREQPVGLQALRA